MTELTLSKNIGTSFVFDNPDNVMDMCVEIFMKVADPNGFRQNLLNQNIDREEASRLTHLHIAYVIAEDPVMFDLLFNTAKNLRLFNPLNSSHK